jgi:phosphoribosylaminoimidazolecarboxamide formyltransferase / IMP cyclohydrolase
MSKKLADIDVVYGENPQQKCYGITVSPGTTDPLAIGKFKLVQGENPSFCNITDVDRLVQTATHIAAVYDVNKKSVPYIALGAKHGNTCGGSVSNDPITAVQRMLDGDLRAIFGGSLFVNFEVDEKVANELLRYHSDFGKRLLDLVIAPSFTTEALALLSRKNGKLRLFANPALASLSRDSLDTSTRTRYVRGGIISQDNYTTLFDINSPEITTNSLPVSENHKDDLLLAWAIAVTSNSNTITIVKDQMLLGNGVGQQDRVTAAELAVKRAEAAGHNCTDAVAYGDSFFPFPDAPEVLVGAGIRVIFASSGSINDTIVSEKMKELNTTFLTHSDRTARGFAWH